MNTMKTENHPGGNSSNELRRKFWTGMLIGGAAFGTVGGVGAYFATKHHERKKARAEMERCKRHFYDKGRNDQLEEDQIFINCEFPKAVDEAVNDVIEKRLPDAVAAALKQVTGKEEPREALKDLTGSENVEGFMESVKNSLKNSDSEALKGDEEAKNDPEAAKNANKTVSDPGKMAEKAEKTEADRKKAALEAAEEAAKARANEIAAMRNVDSFLKGDTDTLFSKNENLYAEEARKEVRKMTENGDYLEFMLKNGDTVKAPRNLFFDSNGESYGPGIVRENIRGFFGKDIRTINRLWRALGFGEYLGTELDVGNISPDELSIDEKDLEDDTDEEAYQRTIERERYLDEVDRYLSHPEEGPRLISRREFNEENYLDKNYVDYYAKDNVFVYSDDVDNPIDNYFELFGVVNGEELFQRKRETSFPEEDDENDPGVVHMKNFRFNQVMEITRNNRAYAELKDGRIYFDGDSGQS